ncbi:rhodanese-like domain-containing protein [Agromyces sp. H3Y2-19a]|jgi:queuine tRNA-ribosyltransferase|uniref:rhodanese-like domain-containing protein n=1 Tax=Agromyces TaxID=33877 RepID=UPI001E55C16C|nr:MULTISPECIES: rhodanese-like domain-containing protein [Agromyces]MCD5346455.1 rhodanese-like domain-containing protein [Agromyces sp. S2-1-8]MDF0512819.1 rhodanese-like domain-containing protein [Agromyces chromiiresistens]
MRSLSPAEVHATDDAYLIDVRDEAEVAQARIDGAHHIPLGELVARLDEVPRDRTVYVLCHVGGRSAQAVVYLEQHGFDAVNIDGGIVGWYREGLPVELGGAS